MTLLAEMSTGWTYPPRAKKAHWFSTEGQSACGKYQIKWTSAGAAYLPTSIFRERELCPKCLHSEIRLEAVRNARM
jgi:hypothetical protein